MISKYILIFLIFILSLNASISSKCIDIEKKYILKKQKTVNCKIVEYVEEEHKNHCIKKEYKKFTREVDNLFSLILNKIDNEFSFETLKSQGVCSTLSRRVYATSIGEQGEDRESKEKDLQNAKNELKVNYKSKLLSSLNLIDSDVPKKCLHALKTFLNKKVNLKKKKYINYARQSYFECLNRHPLKVKEQVNEDVLEVKEEEQKIIEKDKNLTKKMVKKVESHFKSNHGLTLTRDEQVNKKNIQEPITSKNMDRIGENMNHNELGNDMNHNKLGRDIEQKKK